MVNVKQIDEVFESGNFYNVKFTDGTEAIAPKSQTYDAPLEKGEERTVGFDRRKSEASGQEYDLIVMWGTEPVPDTKAASVAAQAPILPTPKPSIANQPAPKKEPLRIDTKDLSIIAQTALKESVMVASQKVALGGSKTYDTDAAIVKRAEKFSRAMFLMVCDNRKDCA